MIPDALTVLILAASSVELALAAVCYVRAKVHARRADESAMLAVCAAKVAQRAADAAHAHASRLDLPTVLPFVPKRVPLKLSKQDGTV